MPAGEGAPITTVVAPTVGAAVTTEGVVKGVADGTNAAVVPTAAPAQPTEVQQPIPAEQLQGKELLDALRKQVCAISGLNKVTYKQ